MSDSQRINPPHYLVWHNAVSPESLEVRQWSDDQVRSWFNAVGKSRTYNGYTHSGHTFNGKETFVAVPFALWPNDNGDNFEEDT